MRNDNRSPDQMRPVRITPNYLMTAEGSALIEVGNTRVLCAASVEETVPSFLRGGDGGDGEAPRWTLRVTVAVLGTSGLAAAFASDWFVSALEPATNAMHMSRDFAGLVVVAIAGNAVENVVGVQLAARNRPDFAISVIVNSALQVALLLTPVLVFASLAFSTSLTLVFPTLLAISLLMAAGVGALVVYDGESTWEEGAILVGLYVVIAASFWWGA